TWGQCPPIGRADLQEGHGVDLGRVAGVLHDVVPGRLSGMAWTMLEREPTCVITTCVGCADRHTVAVGCENGALEIALIGDRFVGLRLTILGAGELLELNEPAASQSRSLVATNRL